VDGCGRVTMGQDGALRPPPFETPRGRGSSGQAGLGAARPSTIPRPVGPEERVVGGGGRVSKGQDGASRPPPFETPRGRGSSGQAGWGLCGPRPRSFGPEERVVGGGGRVSKGQDEALRREVSGRRVCSPGGAECVSPGRLPRARQTARATCRSPLRERCEGQPGPTRRPRGCPSGRRGALSRGAACSLSGPRPRRPATGGRRTAPYRCTPPTRRR